MSDTKSFESTGTELYSYFIYLSRYSRWLEDKGRRETWDETVSRYINFFCNRFPEHKSEIMTLKGEIKSLRVMPSMRALMTAGEALNRDETSGYNCSYLPIDCIEAFDEIMYISMCGTGCGFSVEKKYIEKLPIVPSLEVDNDKIILVEDSRIGWASSFRQLLTYLYSGIIPSWDTSLLRPAGAKLKTFGGRSSGPEPLRDLFKFTVEVFTKAQGRKLTSLECHDIVCKTAQIVVAGGVRRSALISLSDLSDEEIQKCKSGAWWNDNVQRALANNSAVYDFRPSFEVFLKEWHSLYESKSGERGIFSRESAKKQAAKTERRDANQEFGINPCSEIILRPNQFCNLTEVIVRSTDSLEDLKDKVRVATILGTFQSTLTNFRYLRDIWRKNCEEERLLGVSLTGVMDHPILNSVSDEAKRYLSEMKQVAIDTNKEWANKLGINQSTSITCDKPSGTVSQLTNTSSGIHARYAPFYIRTVRADKKDPLATMMKDLGFPCEQDVTNENVLVFSFPIKSPEGSVCASELGAIQQLEFWKMYQDYWCEHKPSVTIYYKDEEFLDVGSWVYKNFDSISGISFLPYSDHVYAQAPYQPISEEQYLSLLQKMPKDVDWSLLQVYETDDTTKSSHTLACSASGCETVDLVAAE